MMPRRPRKPRSISRVNMIAIGLLVIVFGALIAVVSFFNREVVLILPDDRAQVAAERADRDNNAYYVLEQALAMLPERPKLVAGPSPRDSAGDQIMIHRFSTAGRLGFRNSPDSAEVLTHLQDSREAVNLARTAVNRSFFRYPIPIAHRDIQTELPHNTNFYFLLVSWFAVADAQIRYWNEVDDGIASLDDLWTVISMMQSEPQWEYPDRYARSETTVFFKMLHHLIRETNDPSVLDKLDTLLREHPPMYTDFSRVLVAHQRMLDDTLLSPRIIDALGYEVTLSIGDHLRLYRYQHAALFLIKHKADYERLTTLPPMEFVEWGKTIPWGDIPRAGYEGSLVTYRLADHLTAAHIANGMQPASRIVLALQRYRLDHGEYPEVISALVPDYLDAIPKTPATTEGVFYELVEDRYKLEDDGLQRISGGSYYVAPQYVQLDDF